MRRRTLFFFLKLLDKDTQKTRISHSRNYGEPCTIERVRDCGLLGGGKQGGGWGAGVGVGIPAIVAAELVTVN